VTQWKTILSPWYFNERDKKGHTFSRHFYL
jgi:hypothetical protein